MANNLTFRYKQMAMKWLTANYDEQQSLDQVNFNEFDSNQNDFEDDLDNTYFPYGYTIKGIVQGKTNTNNGTEYSVVYGIYKKQNDNTDYGFMLIVDQEYNVVQKITEYSNGDDFRNIISLNVGNDGRFYMVEYDANGYYRFVLLNNILAKSPNEESYQVVMRQTYRFPDQTKVNTSQMMMTKHPEEAKYLLAQIDVNDYDKEMKCLELIINVGSENEWNYYESELPVWQIQDPHIDDMIASWDNDGNLIFKVITTEVETIGTHFRQYVKNANSSTIIKGDFFINLTTDGTTDYVQSLIKDMNNIYITTSVVKNNYHTYNLYILEGNVASLDNMTLIKEIEQVVVGSYTGIRLAKTENDIFYSYQNIFDYVGIIIGSNAYDTFTEDFQSNGTLFLIKVQKSFNLYTLYIQAGNYVNIAKLIYIDGTNNVFFQDHTSMVPYYGVLYNENNKIIFARTLYNKSINGQTTTSTIQVPNQYLNNHLISKESLFGHTYLALINQPDTIEKNEYEEVYFNFVNTWNIINKNDINNPILNPFAATRFNISISQYNDEAAELLNYTYNCITKYRINYSDDSTYTVNFTPGTNPVCDFTQEPFLCTYTMQVYQPIGKQVLSIDLISDNNTVYQTISNLNLTSGKLYTLTQDVYVI